jgi:thymidylate synthase (FAD)
VKGTLLVNTALKEVLEAFPGQEWQDVLQHLSYTFAIEKISRACSHQLVRHRVASFSQQSQRYIIVKKLNERILIPDSIHEKGLEKYHSHVETTKKIYQELINLNVPREDARYLLPNATMTSLLMTMDGKALFHFFGLRCCNRAQWEIRELADKMLNSCRDAEPTIFKYAGPYCFMLGYCPEGKYTCGMIQETIEKYRAKLE